MPETAPALPPTPADDPTRSLALTGGDSPAAQHIGLVGDAYTITVAGKRQSTCPEVQHRTVGASIEGTRERQAASHLLHPVPTHL